MKKVIQILVFLFLIIPLFGQKYDTVTFPEFEEQALKTLANNDITYMDFYFMTKTGSMIVGKGIADGKYYITTEMFKKEGGIINIHSTFMPLPGENLSSKQKFIGMGAVVGIVGNITSNTSWASNKLYFHDMDDTVEYWITTKACRSSSKIKNSKKRGDYILANLHEVK